MLLVLALVLMPRVVLGRMLESVDDVTSDGRGNRVVDVVVDTVVAAVANGPPV